jgi:hypothetical protein
MLHARSSSFSLTGVRTSYHRPGLPNVSVLTALASGFSSRSGTPCWVHKRAWVRNQEGRFAKNSLSCLRARRNRSRNNRFLRV